MSGKAILILVVSFSAIFLVMGKSFFNVSHKSTNEMIENINETRALDIARSATNVIVSFFWQNPDSVISSGSKTLYDSVDFNDGRVVSKLEKDPVIADLFKITTTGYYGKGNNKKQKTVVVLYGPQKLTEMASYSENAGNVWWTGTDSVKGKIYCKGGIKVYNHPNFSNEVYSDTSDFHYYGGNQVDNAPNVDPSDLHFNTELKRPTAVMNDLKDKAQNGGWLLNGTGWNTPSTDTLFLELSGTNMKVKFSKNAAPVTYDINTKVPNKVIHAENYVVRLKGELDGQLLISCHGNDAKGKGKVLLDDDVVYRDDPRSGASNDLLGIVATNSIEIADTPPNQTDININAAIYSQNNGLTAENGLTKPDAGSINFYGSIIENKRMPVGQYFPPIGTVPGYIQGYRRNYEYDDRLISISPPSFPKLAGFNVLAWYEGDAAR